MKECELSQPVADLLCGWGFVAYVEVPRPFGGGPIDMVGLHDATGVMAAVEMKVSLTQHVIQQAACLPMLTPLVYVAVGTAPRRAGLAHCRQRYVGVIRVKDGRAAVVQDVLYVHEVFGNYGRRLRGILDQMTPGGVGGKPCELGDGPAQECWDCVQAYRVTHPQATWRQVFEAVPNHYANAKSMAGAMRMIGPYRRRVLERIGQAVEG